MAGDVVPEGCDNGGEDVLPRLHLDGQDGQAYTQLDPDGLGPRGELLEQQQELAAQRREVGLGDLCSEVVCDLSVTSALVVLGRAGGSSRCSMCTLPLRVVAAKSCASASFELCKIDIVVVQASCYRTVSGGSEHLSDRGVRGLTDFWNLPR